MLDKDFSITVDLHISLQRALRYIRQHYLEDIALSELAKNAFVSPSHLSYLFKSELGTSFKTLLACLRIEKAKRLLVQDKDARITDICLESGFGDLSHFEKTFKKWAGCKPKDFRRQEE
jgi:AraC-like DNA-binding protein